MSNDGAIWLASYPKSGNTWLRCLLEAYRRNGLLDINDLRISHADGDANLIRSVSPVPFDSLNWRGQLLIRPAALLQLFNRFPHSPLIKTHFANMTPKDLGPNIPADLTYKAIYIVRDPRDVVCSLSRFFEMPINAAVATMANKDFIIGGANGYASSFVSSWTNNVGSWTTEERFPVHCVRYEDLMTDAGNELAEVLEFLGETVDHKRVEIAVEAARLSKLQKAETDNGFTESPKDKGFGFFGEGGCRWKDELGPKWVKQIEADHKAVMEALGYL